LSTRLPCEPAIRSLPEGISVAYSRNWHRTFERVEPGRVRIVAVLRGSGYKRNAIPEN